VPFDEEGRKGYNIAIRRDGKPAKVSTFPLYANSEAEMREAKISVRLNEVAERDILCYSLIKGVDYGTDIVFDVIYRDGAEETKNNS